MFTWNCNKSSIAQLRIKENKLEGAEDKRITIEMMGRMIMMMREEKIRNGLEAKEVR